MAGVVYKTEELFQVGMPAWCLSTAFALWCSYERPGKIVVSPAKTDDWAVIELRDTRLVAAIVEVIKEARLHKEVIPVKTIQI